MKCPLFVYILNGFQKHKHIYTNPSLFVINTYQIVINMKKKQITNKCEHSPTLNTVLMVESTLKDSEDSVMRVADLKRSLPKQVNHNVLMTILGYLEDSNKIAVSLKGITWIHNTNPNLRRAIKEGLEL